MKKLLLALLCAAPIAVAQDDCGSCDSADSKSADVKSADSKCCPDADACVDKLADTRKDLNTWKSDRKQLSRIERDLLRSARKTLTTKDASMKALAPTFAAQADLLAALAALEAAAMSENAKVAKELALTFRAMARTAAGKKDAYPAPALKTTADIKVALKKAEADAKAAQALWAKAKKTKLSDEDAAAIKDALDLTRQTSPRMRALAKNADVAGKAMGALKCDKATADGDPRPAIMKAAKSLQDLSSPYFEGVELSTPKPMAPAPST